MCGPPDQLWTGINVPACVVWPPYAATMDWSPFPRLDGTVTLNWSSPGATSPANDTVAFTPPTVIAGSGDKIPDCETDPLITGRFTGPKPFAKSRIVSPGLAGVEPGYKPTGPSRLP